MSYDWSLLLAKNYRCMETCLQDLFSVHDLWLAPALHLAVVGFLSPVPEAMAFARRALIAVLSAQACSLVSAGPLNNLLADLTGQHHDGSSTCLADGHTHACSHASSFTGFFPDAAAPAHSDHFFPSISTETVSGSADAHQGDVAHLDQFDSSLLANRRPKMFVSFDKK